MSLGDRISSLNKEITGSRTKNRLTIQISYAMQLIIEFYSTDFLVLMDYIEDVSVIKDPSDPSAIYLYQVKTKSANKNYLLSAVIKDLWFQKLYENASKYGEYIEGAFLVCNTDIVESQNVIFPNEKTCLNDKAVQDNIKKIKKAIADNQKIDESEIDLSKFFFVRSQLSTKAHKEETEYQFQKFLLELDGDLQVATAKSIFSILYEELDKRFNEEIDEKCTDLHEILTKKRLDGKNIKEIIDCGLSIQMPIPDKIFTDFKIQSIMERKKYMTQYRQIKMDMYSEMEMFVPLKKLLMDFIEDENQNGADEMTSLLEAVYLRATECESIPVGYQDKHYLKMLIMILIYKYCYGDEEN